MGQKNLTKVIPTNNYNHREMGYDSHIKVNLNPA